MWFSLPACRSIYHLHSTCLFLLLIHSSFLAYYFFIKTSEILHFSFLGRDGEIPPDSYFPSKTSSADILKQKGWVGLCAYIWGVRDGGWSWHKQNGKWLEVKPKEDWRRMHSVRCCFAWKWVLQCWRKDKWPPWTPSSSTTSNAVLVHMMCVFPQVKGAKELWEWRHYIKNGNSWLGKKCSFCGQIITANWTNLF